MMRSYLLTPPTQEPVSLADAKLAARLSGTQFDALIPGLITAARQMAEQELDRRLMQQVVRFELDEWPAADDVFSLYRPSDVAVTYWNGTTFAALASVAYVFAAADAGFVLAPALSTSWPALPTVAAGARVRVDATVGAAAAEGVDECVKTYIKAMVAYWVSNPEAASRVKQEPAPFLRHLLDPAKVYL